MIWIKYILTAFIIVPPLVIEIGKRRKEIKKFLAVYYSVVVVFFTLFFLFFGYAIFIEDKYPDFPYLIFINVFAAVFFPLVYFIAPKNGSLITFRVVKWCEIYGYRIMPALFIGLMIWSEIFWKGNTLPPVSDIVDVFILFSSIYSIFFILFIFPLVIIVSLSNYAGKITLKRILGRK